MSYSAVEIQTLASNAAKGAGFPPAQAARFGKAAARVIAASGAGAGLLEALQDPSDSPILRLPLLMEDVQRALALTGAEVALTLHPGDEALAVAYAQDLPMADVRAAVRRMPEAQSKLHVHAAAGHSPPPKHPPRLYPAPEVVQALQALARGTLVPASETSRSMGAGAGDIDNE